MSWAAATMAPMPTTLLNTDLNLPHVKRLIVGLSDDDQSLVFAIEVLKPTGAAAIPVTVPVTSQQVEILLRLAGK